MVKMQTGKRIVVDHAIIIPSLIRGSVDVFVALEDILIVFMSCIKTNVKP